MNLKITSQLSIGEGAAAVSSAVQSSLGRYFDSTEALAAQVKRKACIIHYGPANCRVDPCDLGRGAGSASFFRCSSIKLTNLEGSITVEDFAKERSFNTNSREGNLEISNDYEKGVVKETYLEDLSVAYRKLLMCRQNQTKDLKSAKNHIVYFAKINRTQKMRNDTSKELDASELADNQLLIVDLPYFKGSGVISQQTETPINKFKRMDSNEPDLSSMRETKVITIKDISDIERLDKEDEVEVQNSKNSRKLNPIQISITKENSSSNFRERQLSSSKIQSGPAPSFALPSISDTYFTPTSKQHHLYQTQALKSPTLNPFTLQDSMPIPATSPAQSITSTLSEYIPTLI